MTLNGNILDDVVNLLYKVLIDIELSPIPPSCNCVIGVCCAATLNDTAHSATWRGVCRHCCTIN